MTFIFASEKNQIYWHSPWQPCSFVICIGYVLTQFHLISSEGNHAHPWILQWGVLSKHSPFLSFLFHSLSLGMFLMNDQLVKCGDSTCFFCLGRIHHILLPGSLSLQEKVNLHPAPLGTWWLILGLIPMNLVKIKLKSSPTTCLLWYFCSQYFFFPFILFKSYVGKGFNIYWAPFCRPQQY